MNNDMFYADQFEERLRFGDVISGPQWAYAHVTHPPAADQAFEVRLSTPLAVLLTPCCQVGKARSLNIAPLNPISGVRQIFSNKHFAEDPLRIDAKVEPNLCLPESRWNELEPGVRDERIAGGAVYALKSLFVYEGKPPILPDFKFKVSDRDEKGAPVEVDGRWYYVDFQEASRVSIAADQQQRASNWKKLQVSVETRELLRRKLANFYAEPPIEDLQQLEGRKPLPTSSERGTFPQARPCEKSRPLRTQQFGLL